MPNISLGKMPLETKTQAAGNTRHKDKVEFRQAASPNAFLLHT